LIFKIYRNSLEEPRTNYLKHTGMKKQEKDEEKGSHGYEVITCQNIQ
jgi:hypothetical protein